MQGMIALALFRYGDITAAKSNTGFIERDKPL